MDGLVGGIIGFLLGSGGSTYIESDRYKPSGKFSIISYDKKTGLVSYICPRCDGAGQFEDYSSSCMGRYYYERNCPVCNGQKALRIKLNEIEIKNINDEYKKRKSE